MRILFILLFSLMFNFNSIAQFSTMLNDTLKPFGLGGSDLRSIVKDDSFYYVLGGVNNNEPEWSNMILKFDKNFNIVNKRKYIDTTLIYADYPYNTMVIDKKQIVICPQIRKKPNNPFVVLGRIIALDKTTLDTLWSRIITHPDTAYVNLPNAVVFSDLTAIKHTPDHGYILTGNYNLHCSGADKRSFLLKIDSIGNVEWRRTYSQYYTFFDVEIAADSGYYVPCTINNSSLVLVKFDKNGFYQWKSFVNSNANPSYPMDVSIHGNHAIVSSVFWYDISNSLRALTVAKVDLINHNTIWEKNYYLYNSIKCVGLHQAMGVETLPDGSIIVNGTVIKYGTDYSAFILKLNSNGDSLWTKTHRFRNSNISRSQLNDLLICDDGGFLGVGFYSPQAGAVSSAWMFKTDANGVVGWDTSTPLSVPSLRVYPNPAHDAVRIDLPGGLPTGTHISVYNAVGQLVARKPVGKGQPTYTLNLQCLKPGLYFFELSAGDGVLGRGRFVRE